MNNRNFSKCINIYKHNLTNWEQCNWIRTIDDCIIESYINYLDIFFCNFDESPFYYGSKISLLLLWLIYLFVAIQTISESFLCESLFEISSQLNLNENLCSITFYSFGVASPCIFSAISGIINKKQKIVIASLFGSASFITQLVTGSIFYLSSFRVEALPYLRDVLFYLCLILWIFYIFVLKKQFERFDAFGFLIFYGIYVLIGFLTPRKETFEKNEVNDEIELSTVRGLHITSELVEKDTILKKKQEVYSIFFRILNPINKLEWRKSKLFGKIILIIKSPILFVVRLTTPLIEKDMASDKLTLELRFTMFIQMILGPQLILKTISLNKYIMKDDIPLNIIILIISVFIALFSYYFVQSLKLFRIYSIWHSFVLSIFWIYIVCEEIVSFLRILSIKFNLTEEFIGLTILAWGNASLDLFTAIQIVNQGKPRLASSATISAPFISLLLGVGIPCSFLFLIKSDISHFPLELSQQILVIFISVSIGLIFTSLHLILNNFVVCRFYGVFIILLYLFSIIIEFVLEFKLWSFGIKFS